MFNSFMLIATVLFITSAIVGQNPASQDAKSYFESGIRLIREKKLTEALDAFRNSARLDAAQPSTHGNIGATLIALGRPADAVPAFREAVKLAPNDGTFHTGLCKALSLDRKHQEAINECELGARLAPDSAAAQIALFSAMKHGGRNAGDLSRFIDTALAKFRESELLLAAAADHYSQNGNDPLAANLFEQLIRLNPTSAFYHARLADVYLRLERDSDALAAARKALELEPDNPFANYFMGKLFFELGQHEEASASFKKISGEFGQLSDSQYFLALSEERLGNS